MSALSYYGARYYDSLSLMWTQADPLFRFAPELAGPEPRRVGLYMFSLNNALVYQDPDGLTPAACAANPGGCAAGAAAGALNALATAAGVVGLGILAVTAGESIAEAITSRTRVPTLPPVPPPPVVPDADQDEDANLRPTLAPGPGFGRPAGTATVALETRGGRAVRLPNTATKKNSTTHMAKRKGRGSTRNVRKKSRYNREHGAQRISEARARLDELKKVTNKTPADKEAVDKAERELQRLIDRQRASENHAQGTRH